MSLESKRGKFKKYLVDSTAYNIIPTVVPAYYEPHFAEFSDEVSISARVLNGIVERNIKIKFTT